MSPVFEVYFLFWITVLYSLSSWYETKVCAKLLADYVWSAEEYKTGFLSVGVDIFDQLYLKIRPISLPIVTMSTIKRIYDKWYDVKKLNKIEICEIFDEWSKYYVGLSPLWKNSKNRKISIN